jgi:hypothetical protein
MSTPPTKQPRSGLHRAWLIFFIVGCAVAGLGFFYKLYEFFWALTDTDGFEFAGVHLVTYGLVAGGFLMLLLYGFLKGHFSDIERPKYELLERERAYDHADFD